MRATDIIWDVDGEDPGLPTEIDIPAGMTDLEDISNYLSDVTGYLHQGFCLDKT